MPSSHRGLRFDAVIAGGGVAGSTTAAALASQGLEVLVCEAGLPSERRLAGELMHPPAAAELERLGLLEPLLKAGGTPVYGFAIFDGDTNQAMLSYSEVRGGRPTSVAVDHHVMARTLLNTVATRPGVTVWEGARVLSAQLGDAPQVTVRRDGDEVVVDAPLVVSAEGRGSATRSAAGIEITKGEAFRMVGWRVPGGRLPFRGYGHIFLSPGTATLGYQVAADEVRVMFELKEGDDLDVTRLVDQLPEPFASDVRRAMATETRQTAKVYAVNPSRAASGRLAIVGDAGGCVHPLTATGLAFCVQDATRLAREVGRDFDGGAGVPAALKRYDRGRRVPMASRTALGGALVEALTASTPDMKLLRHGLFRYWERSPRGRRASIGLLSTQETRPAVLAREFASVCVHALDGVRHGVVKPSEIPGAVAGLAMRAARHLRQAPPTPSPMRTP